MSWYALTPRKAWKPFHSALESTAARCLHDCSGNVNAWRGQPHEFPNYAYRSWASASCMIAKLRQRIKLDVHTDWN